MQQWPALHADSHRPVGFNGPDDQGGSDPLPPFGAINEITSNDLSIVVTDPDGPVTDLAVNLQQAWAYDTITVPAGTGPIVDWNNGAGGMLDFSTLDTPKFSYSGLVLVTLLVQAFPAGGDPSWTVGSRLSADFQTPAPTGAFPQGMLLAAAAWVTSSSGGYPDNPVNLSGGLLADIGDGLQLALINTDTVDHIITWLAKIQQIVGA